MVLFDDDDAMHMIGHDDILIQNDFIAGHLGFFQFFVHDATEIIQGDLGGATGDGPTAVGPYNDISEYIFPVL